MLKIMSRRVVVASAALGLLAVAASQPLLAQQKKGPAEVSVEELMKPGPLPDVAIGKADAPVTIVEYASMTCGHCATFHNSVLPGIKEKYIDTGKVRLILREFPLDSLAAAASMLTRCAGAEKSYDVVAQFFKQQETWAFERGNVVPALFKMAEKTGFTKESFDKCVSDEKLLADITTSRDKAAKSFGISSTPTFFINGRRYDGPSDQIAAFERAIEPLLKK